MIANLPVSIFKGQPTLTPQLIYTVPSTAICLYIKEVLFTQLSSAGFGTLTLYCTPSGVSSPDDSHIFIVKGYTAAPNETRYAELSTVLTAGEKIWASADSGGESDPALYAKLVMSGVLYDVVT